MPDDTELLEQIRRGDQAAFRALLQRHARYLYGVAHALCGDATDAEDLVQETLVGALTGSFRGESSVRTWLVRILVNRAAMLRRSRSRKSALRLPDDVAASPASAGTSSTSSIDAKLDLTTMLAQLSIEHRQVMVLRELEGMSYEQIAQALGIPRGTVESRLHRAREEAAKKVCRVFVSEAHMDCDITQLHAYHDGELSPAMSREVEAHVQGCKHCRDLLAELRSVSQLVGSAPLAEISPQAMARLQNSWRAMRDRGVMRIAGWLTAAAASILIGALLLSNRNSDDGLRASPWQTAAVMPPAETRDDASSDLVVVAQWMANDLSLDQAQ